MANKVSKTEWKDITVHMKNLVDALEKEQYGDALKTYDLLELQLERWRSDLEASVEEIQEILRDG